MNLKPIRFDSEWFDTTGNPVQAHLCSDPGDHSGEYYRAEDVREAMAGLVEALERIESDECNCRRCPELCNCSSNIAIAALAALPSPPPRKEAESE